MRYDIRDKAGKFTKIDWARVEKGNTMTIDHETHEQVQEPSMSEVTTNGDISTSTGLVLGQEESVIKGTMSKLADGLVKLSSYAKKFEDMDKRITELLTAIENAEQRVKEAIAERDQAFVVRDEALTQARMAREAYNVVNAERQALQGQLELSQIAHSELRQSHDKLFSDHSFRGDEITRLSNLLNLAQEERDRFREEAGSERTKREDAELKGLELEELKENHDITKRALDDCAARVALLKAEADEAKRANSELTIKLENIRRQVN